MRILIVSDTHGQNHTLQQVIAREKNKGYDRLIHLGDLECDENSIRSLAGCPVELIAGNNDICSWLPSERVFRLGGHTVYAVHGHRHRLYMGMDLIVEEAISRGADILMYGHTHKPVIRMESGITILNPGSLTYPRQESHCPTYIIMEINGAGELQCTIEELPAEE